jgi:hypothetical protein
MSKLFRSVQPWTALHTVQFVISLQARRIRGRSSGIMDILLKMPGHETALSRANILIHILNLLTVHL